MWIKILHKTSFLRHCLWNYNIYRILLYLILGKLLGYYIILILMLTLSSKLHIQEFYYKNSDYLTKKTN